MSFTVHAQELSQALSALLQKYGYWSQRQLAASDLYQLAETDKTGAQLIAIYQLTQPLIDLGAKNIAKIILAYRQLERLFELDLQPLVIDEKSSELVAHMITFIDQIIAEKTLQFLDKSKWQIPLRVVQLGQVNSQSMYQILDQYRDRLQAALKFGALAKAWYQQDKLLIQIAQQLAEPTDPDIKVQQRLAETEQCIAQLMRDSYKILRDHPHWSQETKNWFRQEYSELLEQKDLLTKLSEIKTAQKRRDSNQTPYSELTQHWRASPRSPRCSTELVAEASSEMGCVAEGATCQMA